MIEPQGAAKPTVEESAGIIRDLLAVWRHREVNRLIPILDVSPTRGISALSHADHAASLSDSVLLLVEHDMIVQAVPLVRLTMECGITGAWFSVTPGSGESANLEAARLRRAAIADLAIISGSDPDVETAKLNATVDAFAGYESVEARKFVDRARSIGGAEWVYGYYRLLSAYCHGGNLLVDHYVNIDPGEPLGWSYRDGGDFAHAEIAIAIQAVMLCLAIRASDDLAPEHPKRAKLDEISSRIGLFASIVRRGAGKESAYGASPVDSPGLAEPIASPHEK